MKFLTLRIFILIVVSIVVQQSKAYKILGIFPFSGKSRFTYNNAIMKSLIEAGHDVTVITPIPQQAAAENYTKIIDTSKDQFIYIGKSSLTEFSHMNVYEWLTFITGIEVPTCSKVINLPEIQNMLNTNEKLYDAIFVEIQCLHKCYFPIAEKMNIPVIGTVTSKSWLYADNAIGNPNNPAFIPFDIVASLKRRNFYDRIRNTYNYLISQWFWYSKIVPILDQFHQDNIQYHSLGEYKNMEPALIFYNNHPSFLPKPTNPNAIEVGGIHVKEAKPLPEDIKKFIDEAEHGVILLSFGSLTRAATLPGNIRQAFKEAFAEIPQRVIWKYEEKMENLPVNVMQMDWLPQRDILEHKNVKAFISHCGQGGTYEAIYSATPVISCPLFVDQHGTAALLEDLGVAVHLDINHISKQVVLHALNAIINDTRYFSNVRQLSYAFKDRPITPQQSVVYWTEYVIRHNGAPHLQTAAVHLKWFQYLLLDVLCAVLLSFIVIAFLIYKIVKISHRYLVEIRKKISEIHKNKYV